MVLFTAVVALVMVVILVAAAAVIVVGIDKMVPEVAVALKLILELMLLLVGNTVEKTTQTEPD